MSDAQYICTNEKCFTTTPVAHRPCKNCGCETRLFIPAAPSLPPVEPLKLPLEDCALGAGHTGPCAPKEPSSPQDELAALVEDYRLAVVKNARNIKTDDEDTARAALLSWGAKLTAKLEAANRHIAFLDNSRDATIDAAASRIQRLEEALRRVTRTWTDRTASLAKFDATIGEAAALLSPPDVPCGPEGHVFDYPRSTVCRCGEVHVSGALMREPENLSSESPSELEEEAELDAIANGPSVLATPATLGTSSDAELDRHVEWVYGGVGMDDLERELNRRRNAIGEGTLAAQLTNEEFWGLWRTARRGISAPTATSCGCEAHFSPTVCDSRCRCECNADYVRVERWECRVGCGLALKEPRPGWPHPLVGVVSRYSEVPLERDFIDLDALLRNAVVHLRNEHRRHEAFDEKFEREHPTTAGLPTGDRT